MQANQFTADPRQIKCWEIYVANLAKGIDNASEAARQAGYEESYVKNIMIQDWFKEKKARLARKDMLSKSEKVLDKTLDMETIDEKGKIDPQLLKIQVDVAKTVVTTLGKSEGYSTRTEVTGAEGAPLYLPAELIQKNKLDDNNASSGTEQNS